MPAPALTSTLPAALMPAATIPVATEFDLMQMLPQTAASTPSPLSGRALAQMPPSESALAQVPPQSAVPLPPPRPQQGAPEPWESAEPQAVQASAGAAACRDRCGPRYVLDDFVKIGEPIGSGSYGLVRKVVHKRTAEIFAMKEVPKKKVLEHKMTEYLEREVKTQVSLRHPNVLRLHYWFEDSEKVHLLLEYATNGSLFHRLRKRGRLPEYEAAPIFVDVAKALDFLHKRGVVHRDLKPENILMCAGGVAKVADFGWCAELSEDRAPRHTFCGTWDYLSPEMVQSEPHDFTVDVWALGVLLFEMITGRPPFASSSQVKALARITGVDFQIPESVSSAAANLIRNLLVRDRSARMSLPEALRHPWVRRHVMASFREAEASFGSATTTTGPPSMASSDAPAAAVVAAVASAEAVGGSDAGGGTSTAGASGLAICDPFSLAGLVTLAPTETSTPAGSPAVATAAATAAAACTVVAASAASAPAPPPPPQIPSTTADTHGGGDSGGYGGDGARPPPPPSALVWQAAATATAAAAVALPAAGGGSEDAAASDNVPVSLAEHRGLGGLPAPKRRSSRAAMRGESGLVAAVAAATGTAGAGADASPSASFAAAAPEESPAGGVGAGTSAAAAASDDSANADAMPPSSKSYRASQTFEAVRSWVRRSSKALDLGSELDQNLPAPLTTRAESETDSSRAAPSRGAAAAALVREVSPMPPRGATTPRDMQLLDDAFSSLALSPRGEAVAAEGGGGSRGARGAAAAGRPAARCAAPLPLLSGQADERIISPVVPEKDLLALGQMRKVVGPLHA